MAVRDDFNGRCQLQPGQPRRQAGAGQLLAGAPACRRRQVAETELLRAWDEGARAGIEKQLAERKISWGSARALCFARA